MSSIINENEFYYNGKDCMHYSYDEVKEIQDKIFPASFEYHYKNNEQYRLYCDALNISPEEVKTSDDIYKIPLIPSMIFKQRKVISGNVEDIRRICTSSGTKGGVSKVFRDEKTIERFVDSIDVSLKYIIGVKKNPFFILLGPRPEEAENLWIAYAMSQISKIYPLVHCVEDGKLNLEKILMNINENKSEYEEIVIIGAPIMLFMLSEYLSNNNITFEEEKFKFITAGGWKRFKDKQLLPADFRKKIMKNFTSSKEQDFFDVYNSVEVNTCITECGFHSKHTMPWMKVIALNPENGEPVPDGEEGILAIYDASSISYPCFILSDDMGKVVSEVKCQCGRAGQVVEITRRVERVETRGCALKMDREYTK